MKIKLMYVLMVVVVLGIPKAVSASELAIYSGPTNGGWISNDTCQTNTKMIMNDTRMKKLFNAIDNFGDGTEKGYGSPLGKWVKDHTGNGQQDVLILASGTCPSALYELPNKNPDGSPVEEFVESGNVVINVADWIFFMSSEGGGRLANGPAGAANVFDIPGLTFDNRPPGGGANEIPTALGQRYIPSLKPFNSSRPWHLEQFKGQPWTLHAFAVTKDDPNTADPAVAVSTKRGPDGNGMIAAMWQTFASVWAEGPDPRGIGVVEFISNWLAAHGNIMATVEPQGKLSTVWSKIKNN